MGAVENPLTSLSLDQLRRRTSMKWTAYPPDVLPVWVAEMDVPLAEPIVAAVNDAMAAGDTGYPSTQRYREALAAFADRSWGWTFDVAHSVAVADVMVGVTEMLRLVTRPGDAVVVNPPVYPPFFGFVEYADRRIVEAPLDGSFRIDLEALEQAFIEATSDGRSAAYLLCNPHNPTGTVHTGEELSAVADLAATHGVRVVVDEIHAPIQRVGARHLPYLSLSGTESAFVLQSASKAWNLPGLKAAVAIAGDDAATDLQRVPEVVTHGPTHLGVIAQTAAYEQGEDWLAALLSGIDDNRRLVADLLAKYLPEVGYHEPDATYLAWLDCHALGLGDDPAAVFTERGRVALMSGLPFGTGGEGHVRLNFGTSPEVLEEAVRRMAASV